jgi:hypothetical protein
MVEAVSQIDGDAPLVQMFAVGFGTEAACIHEVKASPTMEPNVVVEPKRKLTTAEIEAIGLKEGEVKQQ